MAIKKVVSGSSVKRVVISSKSVRLEREAVFQLEDAEFMLVAPGIGRLYHPAGIDPSQVQNILSTFWGGCAVTFTCDRELAEKLTGICKKSNIVESRIQTRRVLATA
jgi:hypothetical protein